MTSWRTRLGLVLLVSTCAPLSLAQYGGQGGPPSGPPRGGPSSAPQMGPPTTSPSKPATAKPTPELLALWKELDARRADALKLAQTVEKGDKLDQAHKNYIDLVALTKKFNDMVAPFAETSAIKYGNMAQPKNGIGKGVWLHKASRQIAAYNATLQSEFDPSEFQVIALVNEYREALGLLPLEADLRLRNSARGHSTWMNDNKKLSHDSDLPGLKRPEHRITAAGYKWRSAGENIAFGIGTRKTPNGDLDLNSAEGVFQGWFDSPLHHHTTVGDYIHLGVGHVGIYWTENFGLGEPAKAAAFKMPAAAK